MRESYSETWSQPWEPSIMDVVATYEARGWSGRFASRPEAMVHCHGCQEEAPAEQVPLLATHRLEGASDPGDECLVIAIECPGCGQQGTMVLPYGAGAGLHDGAMLAALLDDRDQSGVEPGT